MREINDDERSFLIDMMKSEGWRLYKACIEESIKDARLIATQRGVETEDRWWHSAEADTYEKALNLPINLTEK